MRKIDLNEIIEKTAELMKVGDKPGHPFRGNQYTSGKGGGRKAVPSRPPRLTSLYGGGTGGGSIPRGGRGKKAVDRAKAKQKVRAERQKVSSERKALKSNGTSKQKQAYDSVVMRGLPQGVGGVDMRLIQRRHSDGMAAARKAGYKG